MANCKIILNYNGVQKEFHSNRELDEFLWEKRHILAHNKGVSPQAFYDINSKQDTSIATLEAAAKFSKGFIDSLKQRSDENVKKTGHSSSLIAPIYEGEEAITIGLSTVSKIVLGDGSSSGTPSPAQKAHADFGTAIHEIIDARNKGRKYEKISAKYSTLSDKKVEEQLDAAIAELKKRHTENGKAPKIITELPIVSKEIYPNLVTDIVKSGEPLSYDIGEREHLKRINGKIDIILIDDNGDCWVYDFKNKQAPLIIGSKDNAKNELNLASYIAMLRQWGLNVKGGGFVEFGVDYTEDGMTPLKLAFRKIHNLLGSPQINNANTFFPSGIKKEELKTLDDTEKIIDRLIPNSTIMKQSKLKELTLDEEETKIFPANDSVKKYNPLAQFQYFLPSNLRPQGLDSKWFSGNYLIGKSKEEVKERLEKYIELFNAQSGDVMPSYERAIESGLRTRNLGEFESDLRNLAPVNYKTIYNHLKKYVIEGWSLIDNEALIQNGIFIFQQPRSSRLEIVALDTHKLNLRLKFNTNPNDDKDKDRARTTILGNFLRDSEVDPMFFLDGTTGNGVLMKVLAYLSLNGETFGTNRISSIKAVSIWDDKVCEEANKKLEDTWTRFVFEAKRKGFDVQLLKRGLLMDDVSAAVLMADDIIRSAETESVKNIINYRAFKEIQPDGIYTIKQLLARLKTLERQDPGYDPSRMSAENALQMALKTLQRGALTYYMLYPATEEDVGPYLDNNVALEGTDASSMQESKSVILRQLQIIVSNFNDVYKQEYEKIAVKWQIKYKAFREEAKLSPIIGEDFSYFRKNWFIQDGDKVHESLRLKSADDSYWKTCGPKEKELYDMYCDVWGRVRYNNDVEQISKAKKDGSFYEIPLVKTNFRKQCEAGGIWDAVKGWAKRKGKIVASHIFEMEDEIYEEEERKKINRVRLPSYIQDLVGDKRTKAIKDNGTAAYETNMDIVFLTALAVGLRRERSEHAMMLTNALRANAYYSKFVNGRTIDNIINAMDKQINAKLYQRSVIDPHNRGIAMLINFCKGVTSTGTLAWNWVSFTRETTKGITDAWSRIQWDEMYNEKFSQKDYWDALEVVASSAYKNIDITSFVMQLSHNFGMANFSSNQIVEASKTMPLSFYEVGSDAMFITATWPDFIHRTAMLIAHLKHIGAYDAYSIGDDGVLTYDMTKDKRFQTYLKYKDDKRNIPEKDKDAFAREYTLYLNLLRDFENAGKVKESGENYIEGDLLPEALSPRTQNNLKVVADRLYGNYDKETKALMQEQLLGALFFQFKTFPLERLAQWFKSPTHINDIEWVQVFDDDGDEVVCVIGEDGTSITFDKYKNIDPEWIYTGRAWFYKVLNGHEVMGHFQRCFGVAVYLFNHNQPELEKVWKNNPYFRGQLALSLYDTFFGVLLAFLIRLMFGEERIQNMKDEEWYSRWLYAVGTGMAKDGPVWGLLSGIVGDGAPPSFSILKNYMGNALSVITGNSSLIYSLADSFGSTKYFTSFLEE